MSGFKHDALADIAQLQEILRDRYDFSSIPKELVQNADDSGAEQLHFAWWPGWPDSDHALLRGPSILVLNDGEFLPKDYEGIQSLGLGSKGGDLRSIGKFGLGMKSIFHLCEAFFYIASANQPAAGGEVVCNILNPWSSSGFHDQWDQLGSQRDLLIRTIAEWPHETSRWLCLWIPLRTRQQLDGKHPILGEYPEITGFFAADLPRRLAWLFPFLGSLKSLTIWEYVQQTGFRRDVSLALADAGSRRRFPNLPVGETSQLSGSVLIRRFRKTAPADQGEDALFRGREIMVRDEQLAALERDDEFWPARPTYDRETAKATIVREKGSPHAGAAITMLPAAVPNKGRLVVDRAVFLPLSSTLADLEIGGSYDFQVLQHGCFFLDAGRRDIYPDNLWNDLLERRGAVPLVLPLLDDLASQARLSIKDLRLLTQGLAQVSFLKERTEALCQEYQWIYRLHADGGRWSLLASNVTFLCVPAPPDSADWHPEQLFPALAAIAEEIPVSFSGWPCLSPRGPSSWVDDAEHWAALLEVSAERFFRDGKLQYLNTFLEQERSLLTREAWGRAAQPLLALGRALFRALVPESVEEHAEELRTFVARLPEKTWFAFPSGDGELLLPEHKTIIDGLLNLGTSILVVPSNLVPKDGRPGTPTAADAALILSWIERLPVPKLAKKAAAVAVELVAVLASADREAVRAKYGDAKVLRAYDVQESREESVSWNELVSWRYEMRLFASGGAFLEPLQRSLSGTRIYRLLGSRTGEVLFPDDGVPACDAAACVTILLRTPVLTSPEQRKSLLERLLDQRGKATVEDHVKALRYLLHGRFDYVDDVSTTLLSGSRDEVRSVWGRLAELALRQTASAWRWVPGHLSEVLSREHCRVLGVSTVGPASVQSLLSEADLLDWLNGESLTTDDRREVLTQLTDEHLWKRLPLHETLEGAFVAIDSPPAYLVDDTKIPEGLATFVTALRIPRDSLLSAVYRARVPEWSPSTCISLALEQPNPQRFQSVILDAIEQMRQGGSEPDHGLQESLRELLWLGARGRPLRPRDVLQLPGLEEALAPLLAEPTVRGAFVDVASVDSGVTQHPAGRWVSQRLYTRGGDALEVLGLALAEVPRYGLGLTQSLVAPEEDLQLLLKAFDDGGPPGFPAYSLLQRVQEKYPSQAPRLARALLKPVSSADIVTILSYLSHRAQQATGDTRQELCDVHSLYLRALMGSPEFSLEQLRDVRLLSRKRRWKAAQELACDVPGIDDADLLDDAHQGILAAFLKPPEVGRDEPREDTDQVLTAEALKDFFSSWGDRVPSEAIGGLLALLGDEPAITSIADEFLRGRRTVHGVREMISWEVGPTSTMAQGAHEDIHQTMARQRFRFLLHGASSDATATVPNLLGEPFKARIRATPEHLFVGRFGSEVSGGLRCCVATFREIAPAEFTKDQLCALLRESAAQILTAVYCRSPENLDEVWEELSQSEQLDLEVAQRLILESAFFYFRQLHDGSLSSLREFGKRWDELRYREAELDRPDAARRSSERSDLEDEKKKIRSELQTALEGDVVIQAETLAAVRRKVVDYQYQESSIPFELFQNADDAASELAAMLGGQGLPAASLRFIAGRVGNALVFLHWGRTVNRFRGGTFSAADGIARGFNRDLEKMLVLSSSDKAGTPGKSSGKFGLGFKSVFLVSDDPKVLSGRLGFEVAGGMFPRRLQQDARERLTQLLEQHSIDGAEGTVVEVPVRTDGSGAATEALGWFQEVGHLLPVFAHTIRTCIYVEPGAGPQTVSWAGRPVAGSAGVMFGRLNPLSSSTHPRSGAMLLRCGDDGSVLLGLGSRGVTRLPSNTPAFWATAPTRELEGRGLAVNGLFAVDVGRAQLARSSDANEQLARTLGQQLGTVLESLHRASDQWQRLRAEMELAPDATPEEFWHSLWDVVSQATPQDEHGSVAANLLKTILWGDDCGMTHLLWRAETLPTSLPGRFSCLTRLEAVQLFTSGVVDEEDVFQKVGDWAEFTKTVRPGTIIGHSVHERLRLLLDKTPAWRPLRLVTALAWEIPQTKNIEPELGARLGEVVHPELRTRLENNHRTKEEGQQLAEYLARCRFQSETGRWREATDLVAAGQRAEEQDESLRAAFAPPDRVLHQHYDLSALAFFRACRGRLRAPAEVLVEWGCETEDPQQREAFLRYLLEGDLNVRVAKLAAANRSDTWLDTLPDSALLRRFSLADQLTILGRLGFEHQLPLPPEPPSVPPSPPVAEVNAFLRGVEVWWSKGIVRSPALDRYVQYQYPRGCELDLSGRDRRSWMTLMIRAMGYTMGRTQDWQTRGFIERCDDRGWLDTFALEPPSQSTQSDEWNRGWVGILNDFAHEGRQYVEYLHWVKLLPIVYRVATHLDQYVAIFRGLDRGAGTDIDPYKILTPALDEELEGGEVAPSLLQSVGLGIFFILRELVRTDAIHGDRVRAHCFVPSLRIRKGFKSLGCDLDLEANSVARLDWSKEIVGFLEERGIRDATFHRAFDIPFIVLSNSGWLGDTDHEGRELAEFWQQRNF